MKYRFIFISILGSILLISCMEKQKEKVGLIEKNVEYSADGIPLKGYLVYDGDIQGKRPGILVVPEWWGLNDYAKIRARMLAELGYTALALDMYGNGEQADNPQDAQNLASSVYKNIKAGEDRFLAAYNFLKNQETTDSNEIAAIGYCFGGGIVLHMARIGTNLKAIVSFHGELEPITPAEKGKVKAFILVCNGAADKFIAQEQIDNFKTEMDSAGVQYKFKNYPGAIHSFTNPASSI
ncbi:MAG: dienelactone hydrolase family protein [Ignavibacteriaceae bacterium]